MDKSYYVEYLRIDGAIIHVKAKSKEEAMQKAIDLRYNGLTTNMGNLIGPVHENLANYQRDVNVKIDVKLENMHIAYAPKNNLEALKIKKELIEQCFGCETSVDVKLETDVNGNYEFPIVTISNNQNLNKLKKSLNKMKRKLGREWNQSIGKYVIFDLVTHEKGK